MPKSSLFAFVICLLARLSSGQVFPAAVYTSDFNSSFKLTPSQIEGAQLDPDLVNSIQNIINYDKSQLVFGGPHEDEFYALPPLNTTSLKPCEIIKVQHFTDPTAYAIPPNTALSRILYTTKNFNGTVIPTSAFILWPYIPRQTGKHLETSGRASNSSTRNPRLSVVVWAHGTSGFFPPQAPSAHRGLWYDHSAPFALALAGYAVFAPDYAGLGLARSWDGTPIPHQYSVSPAAAHDALYGLRAAQRAFPDRLSANFVAMGHSQGGGVAWALAEALALEADEFADLLAGYKGSIAASPTTRVFGSPPAIMGFLRAAVGLGLASVFPTFRLDDWLSPIGTARVNLAREIEGGIGVIQQLLLTRNDTLRDDDRTWYADAFSRLCEAGRKDFAGPLLVLQGADDAFVPYAVTAETVEETARSYPGRDLEFLVAAGVGHVPVLDATRHIWLGWIADRLDGRPVERKGSVRTDIRSFLPVEQYLRVRNNVPLWAGLPEFSYQVVLGA